jgi:hypothetical protein
MSNLEFVCPNTTFLVQPVDMGVVTNLVKYILEEVENGLTSSSAAKGLIARPDLLQAARLARSKHEDHSELVPSWGFKRSDLELPGKVDGENDMLEMHHMEITNYKKTVFGVVTKTKMVKKLLLSELQRNIRRLEN